jgi:ATP-dependent Lon protease
MGYVKDHTIGSGDIRDTKAIQRLASGYMKLLWSDLSLATPELFQQYCLKPAIELRSNVRKQLSIMDPGEYSPCVAEVSLV